ncbi:MAG: ADP-ribosylglycohydrolase family protein [Dehalococcoidia bacterium]|nr:ADP-ribosylglycohydrolase family protein [Dehalococcoidia bacterium]
MDTQPDPTEPGALRPDPPLPGVDAFTGCLLGGAVGDALGAPVEFLSLAEIRSRFGPAGIQDYAPAYGRYGAITDDTQMTLFTAEGLLRARNRWLSKGIVSIEGMVHHAYLRWLQTQEIDRQPPLARCDGHLQRLPELWNDRAPGSTCLSALRTGVIGSTTDPINDSKGCGGVMRVAPVGLVLQSDAFTTGCNVAAITHGHPDGYLPAGFLSAVLSRIVRGADLEAALRLSLRELLSWARAGGSGECYAALTGAIRMAGQAPATPESIELLGEGWVGEEALAISVFCALKARTFEEGVLLAVNHGGDSDSTGAITGNILGALWGRRSIPSSLLNRLELCNEIERIARDLYTNFIDPGLAGPIDWETYPGY